MNLGQLTLRGRRASRAVGARGLLLLPLALLVATLLAFAACSNDTTNPEYEVRPEPEVPPWLLDVYGFSGSDIWAVGQPGLILHYDGSSWQRLDSPTDKALVSVWGPAPGEVYACGHGGTILRWNGASWSTMSSGTDKDLYGLGRFEDGLIYCVGEDWSILRLEGGAWRAISPLIVRRNETGTTVLDTLMQGEDELWLTRVNYYGLAGLDGKVVMRDIPDSGWDWQLKFVPQEMTVTAAWSDESRLVGNYLGTDEGGLLRLNLSGTARTWLELDAKNPLTTAIYGIYADVDTVYLATRDGRIIKRQPGGIRTVLFDGLDIMYGVWGASGTDIWAVGIDDTLRHWNGAQWDRRDLVPGTAKSAAESAPAFPSLDKFGRPLG